MRIAIVSDFFYPRLGGVELHQYSLAQALLALGHKVIVITGTYGTSKNQRQGVRYMTNGLKVYYCPQMSVHSQASLPTLFTFFPLFRSIMIREQIQLIHGHQTTSSLAHECILHAITMGIPTVYTDHSLFGFSNAGAIHLNKLMKFTLCNSSHVVCVSHCMKENIVLRAHLDPVNVSVIPNAVDATRFTPDPSASPDPRKRVNVVIMSRLVYRKGVDLVVLVIPEICRRFPNVHFIIGGDGNKRLAIEEMREKYQLHHRVHLLGAVPHASVRDVLVQGHIFLNCSLTEAFCIAILEAVSCGLNVVCTRVGGVQEVLPSNLIHFAEPYPEDIIEKLSAAIPLAHTIRPHELHRTVKDMYTWSNVAERVEKVYKASLNKPKDEFLTRLERYYRCGTWAGKIFCIVAAMDYLLWCFLEWLMPSSSMDIAVEFPYTRFKDHMSDRAYDAMYEQEEEKKMY